VKAPTASPLVRQPNECCPRTQHVWGDQGKAVGCVPPTALLSQRHIVEAVDFDVDQPNRGRVVLDCELRRSQKGAVVFPQSGTDLGHQTWWPISFQQRAYSLQLNMRYRLSSA
jgi:hypothetical protein